jgi:hypothetical protein
VEEKENQEKALEMQERGQITAALVRDWEDEP